MTSDFVLWVQSCRESGLTVARLEGSGDSGLFATWRKVEPAGYNGGMQDRRYHVWISGKCRIVCPDYLQAYAVWNCSKSTCED